MLTYSNKGKKIIFTVFETVEVEAELDMDISELAEKLVDDPEALEALKEAIRQKGGNMPLETLNRDTDIEKMIAFLHESCWKFTAEEDKYIQDLANKYGFMPNNTWA